MAVWTAISRDNKEPEVVKSRSGAAWSGKYHCTDDGPKEYVSLEEEQCTRDPERVSHRKLPNTIGTGGPS